MKTDLSDDEVKLIVEALEHYCAYTRAAQREDSQYQELANELKKKRRAQRLVFLPYLSLLTDAL